LPALRERSQDIVLLIEFYLKNLVERTVLVITLTVAQDLGLRRAALYRRMEKFGLEGR